ncbi:MAG: bifunctional proline dehydrogenase/L-glutamate gamma-semialdehyde dehydrogenase PutA [Gammaproteobacteria bacterium]
MDLRREIVNHKLAEESRVVADLLAALKLSPSARQRVEQAAVHLVEQVRARPREKSHLDAFMEQFGLSNEEGVALMCLAEALLRVPDRATADALIEEKILSGEWSEHLWQSSSLLVNASTWGLLLTGQVIDVGESGAGGVAGQIRGAISRLGKPVIRAAMYQAMRILGKEFVLGVTIDEALEQGRRLYGRGCLLSCDMLGEGARTEEAAQRHLESYRKSIAAVAASNTVQDVVTGSGISIKLSALYPRFEYAHRDRVLTQLGDRLLGLARDAAACNMGLTIDTEEADRLDLTLELFERMAREPALEGWDGLGIAVQAYGKRARPVLEWLMELARETHRRFTVRLVKGAYWDAEIKHAQEQGLEDFPVFTRKASTDLSYLVCAETLLAGRAHVYGQFATHNAHTIASVMEIAGDFRGFEFQRLHGMGELLYKVAGDFYSDFPRVRTYAPVGGHEDLLAYLVRRLLENGANASFVNRLMDAKIPACEVVRDPVGSVERTDPVRHPAILLPAHLFGDERRNSRGLDLSCARAAGELERDIAAHATDAYTAAALVGGRVGTGTPVAVRSPADTRRIVGTVTGATSADVDRAAELAHAAQREWDEIGGKQRALVLERAADLLEDQLPRLIALLSAEAGKTLPDGLAEVREAVDFCRYYAAQSRRHFSASTTLPGPTGERNEISLHGRGTFVCISPWNFPLAIFAGQVAAALAAGNAVLAKPAEQTPLVAAETIKLMHAAGVPADVLHLLPGDGASIGPMLTSHPLIAGVAFTGSTATAKQIHRALAERAGPILPLIAETGGQNVMFVDSTALLEQVTDDVIRSAFLSAGQRCSALRVLYLQEEIADKAVEMICGAMDTLTVGEPASLATDVGPIIDEPARRALNEHLEKISARAWICHRAPLGEPDRHGTFFAPALVGIDSIGELDHEVFGPILHVIRFEAATLDRMIAAVQDTGYGLTLGIHSRIEDRADTIIRRSPVGNVYVNRNMVGAVVGVQPFGGQRLSGTGPKAGGPRYLFAFSTEKTVSTNTMASGGNAELLRKIT